MKDLATVALAVPGGQDGILIVKGLELHPAVKACHPDNAGPQLVDHAYLKRVCDG